jgi:hypothetical protein
MVNGPIPEGLFVCHRCDTPACINPDHLFLGTNAQNTADRHAKGRSAAGESNGRAKLTAEQVDGIRALRGMPLSAIARRFGMSQRAVGAILRGVNWRAA